MTMRDITVSQISEDIRFGLGDILRLLAKKDYKKLFERAEHHLSAGVLMIAIALVIAIMRM